MAEEDEAEDEAEEDDGENSELDFAESVITELIELYRTMNGLLTWKSWIYQRSWKTSACD